MPAHRRFLGCRSAQAPALFGVACHVVSARARLTETLRARPSPTRHALAPLHVCPNHSQGWRTVLRWLVHQCYVREGRFALLVQLLHLLRATRRAGAGG